MSSSVRTPFLRGLVAALAVLTALSPVIFKTSEFQSILFFVLIYATLASGWNLIGGYAGYVSLGHAVFFGIGAYVFSFLSLHVHMHVGYASLLLVPLAGLAALVASVPMGLIALRLRILHAFVIVTIAFLFMFQILAANLIGLTGGTMGLFLTQPNWSPTFFDIPFDEAALFLLGLTVFVSWWVRGSKFGLGLLAIRDDEDKAAGIGVDTWRYKFTAYALSSVFCGMAGGLFALFIGNIYPTSVFDPLIDLAIVVSVFLGGMGTLAGPIIGAIIVESADQLLTLYSGTSGDDLIFLGLLLIVVILMLPKGVVPTLVERLQRRRVSSLVRESSQALDTFGAQNAVPPGGGAA